LEGVTLFRVKLRPLITNAQKPLISPACATGIVFSVSFIFVQPSLPAPGTAELLEVLTPYIPDEFINRLLPGNRRQGRRRYFNAAQLWRVHLLALLSPAHSFNALARLLPEQPAWRRFALLDHRRRTPDVRIALTLS
jgi:hypothetical protein